MDRLPLPPPFAVGTRLRYVGTYRSFADADGKVPLQWPGMETTVTRIRPGRRGTLRQLPVEDGDEAPLYDTTRDGYSVWEQSNGHGRIISHEGKHEWEVLP
jgi:hypothetical protein